MSKPIDEQVLEVTTIESEGHFLKVGLQLLLALTAIPRADQSAFEEREFCRQDAKHS